jgi:hypothetical protein
MPQIDEINKVIDIRWELFLLRFEYLEIRFYFSDIANWAFYKKPYLFLHLSRNDFNVS